MFLQGVWTAWVAWYAEIVHTVAPDTPLCVGFNTWEDLLSPLYNPGALDFDCHHAYADTPTGYSNSTVISWVPTVLDRLLAGSVALGTPRPIMLGETGSSNGEFIRGRATGGPLLDVYSAAAFDALPQLLSLAHGHSGALRWQVRAERRRANRTGGTLFARCVSFTLITCGWPRVGRRCTLCLLRTRPALARQPL